MTGLSLSGTGLSITGGGGVAGSIALGTTALTGTGQGNGRLLYDNNGVVGESLATTDSSGNLTSPASIFLSAGLVGTPSLAFTGDPTTGLWQRTTTTIDVTISGTNRYEFTALSLKLGASNVVGWVSATAPTSAAPDTGFSRVNAGIVALGNGTSGNTSGTLQLATLTVSGTLQSGAPAGASAGLWKLGSLVTAAVVLDTTRSVFVDIGGVVYKLMVAQ